MYLNRFLAVYEVEFTSVYIFYAVLYVAHETWLHFGHRHAFGHKFYLRTIVDNVHSNTCNHCIDVCVIALKWHLKMFDMQSWSKQTNNTNTRSDNKLRLSSVVLTCFTMKFCSHWWSHRNMVAPIGEIIALSLVILVMP